MSGVLYRAKDLLHATYTAWRDDNATRLSAALAYYAIFSLAPLLIMLVAAVDVLWGQQSAAVQVQLLASIESVVGARSTDVVRSMLESRALRDAQSGVALVVGSGILIVGATGVFVQLQDALNTLWHVRPGPDRPLSALIRTRLLSFALILLIGLLVALLLVVSALIAPLGPLLAGRVPGGMALARLASIGLSLAVLTLGFGVLFWQLPDADIAWGDAWRGAAFTAVLFTLGQAALGLYLGRASVASAYGAAGSLVVLLLWIYYSALIVLFGAVFTRVYARHRTAAELPRPAPADPLEIAPERASPGTWGRRLGWVALGVVLSRLFRSKD